MDSDPDACDEVEIWTDGGCKPNPGPGGWAAVLTCRGRERELTGAEPQTTNNRMELTAAAAALEALKRPCNIALHTDSEYVRNGVTRWSTGWVRRNWRTAPATPSPTWTSGVACSTPRRVTPSSGAGSAVMPATS